MSQLAQFDRANGILLAALGLEAAIEAGNLASVRALDVASDANWPE